MSTTNFYRIDGWVKTSLGPAVAGAQIWVLSQPANVVAPTPAPRTTPIPFSPNPTINIFSDQGITPITQPVVTDGQGHYDFYISPQIFTLAVYYGGKLQVFYPDQSAGSVGSAGGTTIALLTNGSPNFNQNVLNLQQGAGITIVTDNLGNATFTSTALPGGVSINPTPPTPGQVLTATSSTTSIWETPSGGGGLSIVDKQIGIMSGTTTLNFFIPTSGMYLVNFCFNVTSTNNAGSLALTSLNTDQNGNSGGTQNIGSISPIVGGSMNGPYNFSLLGGSLLYWTVTFSGTITSLTYIVTLVKVS